jgi:carbonyl reductase 1
MPVAVVTGANKGIGFGIVRALCKKYQGDVYLTARDEARGLVIFLTSQYWKYF